MILSYQYSCSLITAFRCPPVSRSLLILAGHDVLSPPLSSRPSECVLTLLLTLLELVGCSRHLIEEGARLSHILYLCTYIYTYNTSLPIRLLSSRGAFLLVFMTSGNDRMVFRSSSLPSLFSNCIAIVVCIMSHHSFPLHLISLEGTMIYYLSFPWPPTVAGLSELSPIRVGPTRPHSKGTPAKMNAVICHSHRQRVCGCARPHHGSFQGHASMQTFQFK